MASPIEFRNITRYVTDIQANLPLYEALGFKPIRQMEGMAILTNAEGLKLILHRWDERPATLTETALSFTITGEVPEARKHLEQAGLQCLREPEKADEGFFFVYGDLNGNPINLVGQRPGPA